MAGTLRTILLTHGGAELVLERLTEIEGVSVVAVIIETKKTPQRTFRQRLQRSAKYDGYAQTALKFGKKLLSGRSPAPAQDDPESNDLLQEFANHHGIPVHTVADYHAPESLALISSLAPDLGVVFGTNILKEPVFAIPKLGSINFHSGLAPFFRGGPPVFWELFNDEREVGLTVHWVVASVDSGDIIIQETAPLNYDYSYGNDFESFIGDYRNRLKDRTARLVAEAVRLIVAGKDIRLAQDATLGQRYRLPTKKERDELCRRLRARRRKSPEPVAALEERSK